MGFCHEKVGHVSIETRRESFIVHADYGYTDDDEFDDSPHGKHWREAGHPEFLLRDLDDLITALERARSMLRGERGAK